MILTPNSILVIQFVITVLGFEGNITQMTYYCSVQFTDFFSSKTKYWGYIH